MAKHKTKRKRNKRSKLKVSFAKMREDAQHHNVISTTPEGAVRDERVDPALQDQQRFPGLDRAAIRDGLGWSVPDSVKRKVVEVAAEMVHERVIDFVDVDGSGNKVPVERPNRKAQIEGAKILMDADQQQYKRDEPLKAGQAAGASQFNVTEMIADMAAPDPEPVEVKVARMIAPPTEHKNGDGK